MDTDLALELYVRSIIRGWHRDYLVSWAGYRTARMLGVTVEEFYQKVGGHDRVRVHSKSTCRVFLASAYQAVSNALFDGATNDQAYQLWLKTERKDWRKTRSYRDAVNERNRNERSRVGRFKIRARSLDPSWNHCK